MAGAAKKKSDAAPRAGRVRVGVGGWIFEPWRGLFYPEGLPHKQELAFASRALTSIEVNATFYRGQTPATFEKWRDETPDDFVFALKGPRYAVNRRVLAEAGPAIERFFTTGLTRLGPKLGPINWQFAPTKRFDRDDVAAFLALLPKEADGLRLRHAVEARHESFRDPAFVDLARAHGVAIVVAGDSDYPLIADRTADFVYARVMGTAETRPRGYAPKALEAWAARARLWAEGGAPADLPTVAPAAKDGAPRDVFLYVISGAKRRNPAAAQALIARLGGGDR
ncbi:MAG TPA: DUF72 domain-containing protein [Beijerinckiaceae bacterium]|jgi:uncharacterized protein YecE (DUF72 family)